MADCQDFNYKRSEDSRWYYIFLWVYFNVITTWDKLPPFWFYAHFLKRENTANPSQVFPCEKNFTGKTLFSLQGWVCSELSYMLKTGSDKIIYCVLNFWLEYKITNLLGFFDKSEFFSVYTFEKNRPFLRTPVCPLKVRFSDWDKTEPLVGPLSAGPRSGRPLTSEHHHLPISVDFVKWAYGNERFFSLVSILILFTMAIRVVEFSNGGYKIRKVFA